MIYIFDLDGTIADLTHRLHFIKQDPPDWRAFFAACGEDTPIYDITILMDILNESSHILLVSGRSDECEQQTRDWLTKYGISFDAIYMRKAGDHRPDNIVKSELLDQIYRDYAGFTTPEKLIAGVFEDRDQVVKMYRERGLRVFQVAEGKF